MFKLRHNEDLIVKAICRLRKADRNFTTSLNNITVKDDSKQLDKVIKAMRELKSVSIHLKKKNNFDFDRLNVSKVKLEELQIWSHHSNCLHYKHIRKTINYHSSTLTKVVLFFNIYKVDLAQLVLWCPQLEDICMFECQFLESDLSSLKPLTKLTSLRLYVDPLKGWPVKGRQKIGRHIWHALLAEAKNLEMLLLDSFHGESLQKVRDVRWRLDIDIAMVDGQVKRKFDGRW